MSRPEEREKEARTCFTEPAGESPVQISPGVPGSRPQPIVAERRPLRRGSNRVGRNIK